jgi:hypothetical protein
MPALVITYSRFQGLKNVIDSCIRAGVTRIYVCIDGPRDSRAAEIQGQMRSFLSSIPTNAGTKIMVWQREENLGIAISVITAIDWFFRHEESGVILEDDLEISDSFIKFSEKALSFFWTSQKIVMISGNRYDRNLEIAPVLVSYPQTWGWGTWRHKWIRIRESIILHPSNNLKLIEGDTKRFWQVGSTRVWDGYIDTWDLLVAYAMLRNETYCLLPPENLVTNVGNDSYSTHTNDSSFPIRFPAKVIDVTKIEFNEFIESPSLTVNKFLEQNVFKIRRRHRYVKYYKWVGDLKIKRKYPKNSFIQRLNQVSLP